MILDEGRHEKVAVIVAFALVQCERLTGFLAGGTQQVGPQLIEERIGGPLVDEQLVRAGVVADDRGCIVIGPGRFILAEIGRQRLMTPCRVTRR